MLKVNISSSSIATAVLVRTEERALGRSRRTEKDDIKMDLK
jgi:hypothetical protein